MKASRLESAPTVAQKQRLSDWLGELMVICQRYRIALECEDGELIDTDSGTVIGVGVAYLIGTDASGVDVITAYDCTGSILDGVWLVDTATGPTEQRLIESP